MIISDEHKYVFVSTPKVATHSFYDLLVGKYSGSLYDYNQRCIPFDRDIILHPTKIPSFAKDYLHFTIVRNPYERAVSAWWDIMKPHKGDKYEKLIGGRTFTHYTEAVKSYPNIVAEYARQRGSNNPFVSGEKLMAQFTSQSKWHECNKYGIMLRIEDIQLERLPFMKRGEQLPTVYALKSERKPWQEYYTPQDYKNIQAAWAEDFTGYGYEL